jgi:hypothetical protein
MIDPEAIGNLDRSPHADPVPGRIPGRREQRATSTCCATSPVCDPTRGAKNLNELTQTFNDNRPDPV